MVGEKMRVITVMLLLFVLFMGVVYGTLSATGNERVDMSGKIIGLCSDSSQCDGNAINSILVEGSTNGGADNQSMSIMITKNTTISHKYGDNLVKASINDLHPGQNIQIQFTGDTIYTYPPQTNASQIIILYQ
jgi:hypothetical protein